MIISNVNIGSGVGVGDGDSLYVAFNKVNQNFANVLSNVSGLTNSVTSVAGRTGAVTLTIADVVGLSVTYASQANITTANTLMKGYVDEQVIAANTKSNTANIGMKGYVDLANSTQSAIITSLDSSLRSYVNGQIIAANSAPNNSNVGMKGYVDNAVSTANISLKGYVDSQNTAGNTYVDTLVSTANIGMLGYVSSQVTAANVAWQTNATIQSVLINSLNTAFVNLAANAEIQQSNIYTLETRINTVNSSISLGNTIQSAQIAAANVGIIGYIGQQITTANVGIIGYINLANTIQSAQVGAANLAITAANLGMRGYVDSVASQSIYGNGNVASYLTTYSGNLANISVGNITVNGTILRTGYNIGEVVSVKILGNTDVGFTSNATINTTNYTQIMSYSYTPLISNSYIIAEVYAAYSLTGYGSEDYYSQITVSDSEICYGYQLFIASGGGAVGGGGTRSATLTPLMGRYTNSNSSAKSIAFNMKRGATADDTVTVFADNSFWLKITEVAR